MLPLTPIAPKRPIYLIDNVIPLDSITLITGDRSMDVESFLSDVLFSCAFGKRFHGRAVTDYARGIKYIYVGDPERISMRLWAWNYDRNNCTDCENLYVTDSLKKVIQIEGPKLIVIESEGFSLKGYEFGVLAQEDTTIIAGTIREAPMLTRCLTHIDLIHDLKENLVTATFKRQVLSNTIKRFGLGITVVDHIEVFKDSDCLDESITLLFTLDIEGVHKQKVRIIDLLAMIYSCRNWPSASGLQERFGCENKDIIDAALNRTQNLRYIDITTQTITPKGRNALINHGIIAT